MDAPRKRTTTRMRRALALAAVAVLGVPAFAASPAAAQAAGVLGRSPEQAAVSCWDIKQRDPAAPDGTYWLLTPAMAAPQRFHCDMTTDGGGWVLIARGRDGWQFTYDGQGLPDQVHEVVDGPDAFTPRALPATTVDELLNGGRPDQLTDSVRLRRATSVDGGTRQEVRFRLTARDRWVWTMGAAHPVGAFRFDNVSGFGGSTAEFGTDQGVRRVRTDEQVIHGYSMGWGLGSGIVGSSSPSSYLWSTAGEGNALGFTQVYLRPRLTAASTPFSVIPDTGAPADAQRPLLSDVAEPAEWGVTGRANGGTNELNTEVQAFAQAGDRMIVGGNFSDVQRGADASGADRVHQPYLAAFDLSGNFLGDFRPTLDGQVKDAHVLPNGSVAVAGEFTVVNGVPAVGLVALDPQTGAIDPTFHVEMENRISGGTVQVAALDAEGPWLYLGGRFTHLAGGSRASAVYARMGARVSLADGTPDANWNPVLSASVRDLHASPQGDRVYFAGHFVTANGQPAVSVAIISTAAGAAPVPGLGQPSFSATKNYQQAIREVGDRVWHGGAEHMLYSYTRSTFSLLTGNITRRGGDFQAIDASAGAVYATCHCDDYNYSDAYVWTSANLPPSWSQADNISFVGAWDAATGDYLPEFVPRLDSGRGQGPWKLFTDSTGTMWVGGDLSRSETTGGRFQWIGGFTRFRPRDSVAPSRPGPLSGGHSGTTTTLSWGAATDDRSGVVYEVLRNDRVIATTGARTIILDSPPGASRYFVRAVDAAGNRSATTVMHAAVAPK